MTDINLEYKARFRELALQYGGAYSIPREKVTNLAEWLRLQWVALTERREETPVESRHDKSQKLAQWVNGNIGAEVTPAEMCEAAGCSIGTVHRYLNDNRSAFATVARGRYQILDTASARAAAKAATTRATAPVAAASVDDSVDAAAAALRQIGGH